MREQTSVNHGCAEKRTAEIIHGKCTQKEPSENTTATLILNQIEEVGKRIQQPEPQGELSVDLSSPCMKLTDVAISETKIALNVEITMLDVMDVAAAGPAETVDVNSEIVEMNFYRAKQITEETPAISVQISSLDQTLLLLGKINNALETHLHSAMPKMPANEHSQEMEGPQQSEDSMNNQHDKLNEMTLMNERDIFSSKECDLEAAHHSITLQAYIP